MATEIPLDFASATAFTNVPRTNAFCVQLSLRVNSTHAHCWACLAASMLLSCRSASPTFQEHHAIHVRSQLNTLPQWPLSSERSWRTRCVTHLQQASHWNRLLPPKGVLCFIYGWTPVATTSLRWMPLRFFDATTQPEPSLFSFLLGLPHL